MALSEAEVQILGLFLLLVCRHYLVRVGLDSGLGIWVDDPDIHKEVRNSVEMSSDEEIRSVVIFLVLFFVRWGLVILVGPPTCRSLVPPMVAA